MKFPEAAKNLKQLTGSGRPWTVHTAENDDPAGDLMFSHEGAPQTYVSCEFSSNTWIHWSYHACFQMHPARGT